MKLTIFKWAGSVFAFIGVLFISLGTVNTLWIGFSCGIISNGLWGFAGVRQKDYALLAVNLMFCIMNIVGIIHWGF